MATVSPPSSPAPPPLPPGVALPPIPHHLQHPRPPPAPPEPFYITQRGHIDIDKLSNDEILDLCNNAIDIKNVSGGFPVYWITKTIVVKVIYGVALGEAPTQQWVYDHADPNILRVPKIHRYFEVPDPGYKTIPHAEHKTGYIVMEFFLQGCLLANHDLTEPQGAELISKVIKAVEHLRTLPRPEGQGPGPLGRGEPKGPMWSDDGAEVVFHTVQDMQDWMNTRMRVYRESTRRFDLSKEKLELRHMDLARRNIIVCNDGGVALIDWGCAGFYPSIFEKRIMRHLALDRNIQEQVWYNALMDGLEFPTTLDEEEVNLLVVPAFINLSYLYVTLHPASFTNSSLPAFLPSAVMHLHRLLLLKNWMLWRIITWYNCFAPI